MNRAFVSLTVMLLGATLLFTPTNTYMYEDISARRNEDRIRRFAGEPENSYHNHGNPDETTADARAVAQQNSQTGSFTDKDFDRNFERYSEIYAEMIAEKTKNAIFNN